MNRYRFPGLVAVLVILCLSVAACFPISLAPAPAETTPSPVPTIEPTLVPTLEPTATATPEPTATEVPVATEEPTTAVEPAGPKTVVITEADLQQAITSGALTENGVDANNLQVRFTDGKVNITADRLSYSLIQVNNLVVIGKLVAKDGVLQLETESVSPGGFVTSMLPTMANQALRQYGANWYVEQVTTSEGQVELTVR